MRVHQEAIDAVLARINTLPLQRQGIPTVALVAFNFADAPVSPCRARFTASFPTRATKPVSLRDDNGNLVPSRIVDESFDPDATGLCPGYILWTLTLEFALADGLPPASARAFAATYEASPEAVPPDDSLSLRADVRVCETTCHAGDLPTRFEWADGLV